MILDFLHSIDNYSEISDFYGIWNYECPVCHVKKKFYRHGTYKRFLVLLGEEGLYEELIEVLRLKCTFCNTTHAVLTSDMIPFMSYSIQAILFLVNNILSSSVLEIEKKTGVSYQLLYRFLSIFSNYFPSLFILFHEFHFLNFVCVLSVHIIIFLMLSYPLNFITKRYFEKFGLPLFLNRRSTSLYSLWFGLLLT